MKQIQTRPSLLSGKPQDTFYLSIHNSPLKYWIQILHCRKPAIEDNQISDEKIRILLSLKGTVVNRPYLYHLQSLQP